MKLKASVLIALALSMALGACNTVAGAGRDISSAGRATTGAAEDAKN